MGIMLCFWSCRYRGFFSEAALVMSLDDQDESEMEFMEPEVPLSPDDGAMASLNSGIDAAIGSLAASVESLKLWNALCGS